MWFYTCIGDSEQSVIMMRWMLTGPRIVQAVSPAGAVAGGVPRVVRAVTGVPNQAGGAQVVRLVQTAQGTAVGTPVCIFLYHAL
jgi:hypothetical protein